MANHVEFGVVRHFFLGIGPTVYTDLYRTSADNPNEDNNKQTSFGFSSVVGGWL